VRVQLNRLALDHQESLEDAAGAVGLAAIGHRVDILPTRPA
jgi:hypothetical protein